MFPFPLKPRHVVFLDLHCVWSDIRDQLPREKKDTLSNAREQFIRYPYSVVKVFDLELEDAVEVFQRINQEESA
jgi:hypothetical protein